MIKKNKLVSCKQQTCEQQYHVLRATLLQAKTIFDDFKSSRVNLMKWNYGEVYGRQGYLQKKTLLHVFFF